MNDIKLVESNEQPMKNHLLSSHERIRSIYWAIELELRGWDIRSAFVGGTVSAIVYVTFLKYISDRRDQLGLQVSDLYRYDALLNLYPNVVNQQELSNTWVMWKDNWGFLSGCSKILCWT